MDVEEELRLEQHALRGMNEGSTPQVADVRAHLAGGMYDSAWERVLERVAQVFGLAPIFKERQALLRRHRKELRPTTRVDRGKTSRSAV